MQDTLTAAETTLWDKPQSAFRESPADEDINQKYASREWRIVTESNREQLPNFVDALKRPGWMEVRPAYQRRRRWREARQSKLIESFIMNIPVPPLFVYEADLAKYEVMDGQQRITSIRSFYANELVLTGLEQWPELNGRTYSKLPSEIRKGIDRRSISYTVLLKESAETSEAQALLRQQVFERLNTGGIELSQQEVRNSLYQGSFNSLLLDLARHPLFRQAWGLPAFVADEDDNPSDELTDSQFFSKMQDVEVVLRFFALRHAEHYQKGMQGFLDLYMLRSRRFGEGDLAQLRDLFNRTIALATNIYRDSLFRPWDPGDGKWSERPSVAFADAVLVGLARNLDHGSALHERRDAVIEATRQLIGEREPGTFTGRGNTRADVNERISLFASMLERVALG